MPEQIVVSYSELDTYRQCPLKHFLSYGQRWSKPTKPDGALARGSLYHAVQEDVFRLIKVHQDNDRGRNPREGTEAYAQLFDRIREAMQERLWDPVSGTQTDMQELIEWMMEGWFENFGLMDEWRIMGVEHQILTPLRNAAGRRTHYILKAKIDLIVKQRTTGGLWVVDHKSGANLPSQMDLEIDDQFGLYDWAMREMGRPVTGTIHAANRTQRNKSFMPLDTRMKLTYMARSRKELENIALDAYAVARSAHPPKSQQVPRYSSPDPRQCGWKCDFKEPHLLMRQGRKPAEVLQEYGFRIDRTRH